MLHFAKWKVILVLAISVLGVAYALPNFFSEKLANSMPTWLPHNKLNLGLDLRGGSHILLTMSVDELMADWRENLRGDVRTALRPRGKKAIGYTGLKVTKEHVQVRIRKPEDFEEGYKRIKALAEPLAGNVFTGSTGNNLEIEQGEDGLIRVTPTAPAVTARINSAITASIETIRRRVDALGTTEPTIQRQGQDRILVQVPGLQDPQRLKDILGRTAKLSFHLTDTNFPNGPTEGTPVPPTSEVVDAVESEGGIKYVLKKRAIVTGEELVDAQPSFDQRTNEPVITFRFNTSGARRFGKVTKDNVGRPFAIVLDNGEVSVERDGKTVKIRDRKVISAPVIREAILGGSGQISGNFSVKETNDLAILLRSGALPATLTIIEERSVGPSLGADSIRAGAIAAIIGLAAVVIFILAAYGLFGVFSTVALLINIGLIIGALSMLQATLTLPGIAGIVLTIGMAVDANVLIFERIREELRAGKSAINAIDSGYSRALGTILDANITTFIAAIILFWLGSGPIRGFAVTLSIGIVTSVFTAFTLTRLMVVAWLQMQRSRSVQVPI